MKRVIIFCAIMILLSSCANVQEVSECVTKHTCNFWHGLWHGIILPISFIGSIFSDNIAIYSINNNGGWYDFGFALGVGALFGGSSNSSKS